MHGIGLPANILTSVASDAVSNIASRVASTAQSFASGLQQAQSSGNPASSSVSSSFNQLRSDLQSGNLTAAQNDLTALGHSLPIKRFTGSPVPLTGPAGTAGSSSNVATNGATSSSTDPVLAALQNANVMQQAAYSTALSLSMPSSSPSISLNF